LAIEGLHTYRLAFARLNTGAQLEVSPMMTPLLGPFVPINGDHKGTPAPSNPIAHR